MGEDRKSSGHAPLVDWLRARDLLRGPFVHVDYWADVLALRGGIREVHVRDGFVDPAAFRAGLDRPDLELPRSRWYLLLFFLGPLLLPFRAFRRLGRYRIRFRARTARAAREALAPHELELEPNGDGRVRASLGGRVLAEDLLDPRRVAGFCSLFYAVYKLPLASLTAILAVAIPAPLLVRSGWGPLLLEYWIPVGYPLLVLLLWALYRSWWTALLGALPVLFGRYLLAIVRPSAEGWAPFFWGLGALFVLYLVVDWFFMPRPVPPSLFLYSKREPARSYEREEDAPWWLEGEAYWVWRYLLLTPGEINKFWERDWERAELWIRADGPEAGALEWVVTDAHYRELWIPYERLGPEGRLERHARESRARAREGRPGLWVVEVDANVMFHTPFVRTVSFVAEEADVPVRSLRHLASGLFQRGRRDDPEPYLHALDAIRLRRGTGILDDVPELALHLASRHVLSQPWTHWRYPLGAHRRRERRVYEAEPTEGPPPPADPELQVKAGAG